jgi:hypothetical protein
MLNFNTYFKTLFFFIFFSFMLLYVFSFSYFVQFNSFVDEEIVIFIAIGLVSYFFLKLNLKELHSGINSRITIIETDFKKNYKVALENLAVVESAFHKAKNLTVNTQKNFNFFFNDYVSYKFTEFEDRFFKELFLVPKINFLKVDFLTLIDARKTYKVSTINKAFSVWNQKNLFKSNFFLKNWI